MSAIVWCPQSLAVGGDFVSDLSDVLNHAFAGLMSKMREIMLSRDGIRPSKVEINMGTSHQVLAATAVPDMKMEL